MAGISSKAAGKVENKKNKFQGQEFDEDLGINYYGFKWRNHDPQIGRFIEIDPLADKYPHNSTYAFSENKVTNHVELEGLEAVSPSIYKGDGMKSMQQAADKVLTPIGNILKATVAMAFAIPNMMGDMHAAGNAKNSEVKKQLERSAKNNAALAVESIVTGEALGVLGKGLAPEIKAAIGSEAGQTVSPVSEFLGNISEFQTLKNDVLQGTVTGNAQEIFGNLTKDAVQQMKSGAFKMEDGSFVNYHPSTKTSVPTIDIKTSSGQVYKIRVNE